jgi:hypothetical protein
MAAYGFAPGNAVNGTPEVSIIVPARNEEACLGACLESLAAQTGSFEILVVDDASTDRTRGIAASFPGVRVLDADPLPPGWGGKSNACWTGARQARSTWLLFTDADTVHAPGSLARSLAEAKEHRADLLSYSPAQALHGFGQHAVMPLVFADLACRYRPRDVCDLSRPDAAANGQYLLVRRDAYEAVGGHAAIAQVLLEDVELARRVKRSGGRLRFRYGGDAVRTSMYRDFAAMREGWTKNLAALFPKPGRLALARTGEFAIIVAAAVVAVAAFAHGPHRAVEWVGALAAAGVALAAYSRFLRRVARAHFSWTSNLAALAGLPIFSYLLLRSRLYYKRGSVTWKGRSYRPQPAADAPVRAAAPETGVR